MNEVMLFYNGVWKLFLLPAKHNDLNKHQALALCEVWHTEEPGPWLVYQIAKCLFGVKKWQSSAIWLSVLDAEKFKKLKPFIEPFLSAPKFEKQLVPGFWHKGIYYSGPNDRLNNITLVEFVYADHHFLRYCKTQDPEDLIKLLACLYRPWRPFRKDSHGDSRTPFNPHNYEARAKRFSGLHIAYAFYALEFYRCGREHIVERCQPLFTEEEPKGPRTVKGWYALMNSMAGDKFGTVEQTGHTRLDQILLYCIQVKEENDHIKAKTKH